MKHVLVTHDFPPKVGGIQSYLWELWHRLPPDDVTVLTTSHEEAAAFDASQAFRIDRVDRKALWPSPGLARRIDDLADEVGAGLVMIDPALPLGLLVRWLEHPYGVVLHGAEVTVPGRLPLSRWALGRVLVGAELVIAAGGYPEAEGERAARRKLPSVVVPPGVDVDRFRPLDEPERRAARERFGVAPDSLLVVSLSRLVPRKGMDVLIRAAAKLRGRFPNLEVVIGGDGRDRARLEELVAETGAPVRLIGVVDDEDLPAFYGCADVYAMLCRNRWFGLEQEGFGIVFLEAAACGVPQIAGRSGGSHEAVASGETGIVLSNPRSVDDAAEAMANLLESAELRQRLGRQARSRAESEFTYPLLAERLAAALDACEGARP